jgi:hypothetical protein
MSLFLLEFCLFFNTGKKIFCLNNDKRDMYINKINKKKKKKQKFCKLKNKKAIYLLLIKSDLLPLLIVVLFLVRLELISYAAQNVTSGIGG